MSLSVLQYITWTQSFSAGNQYLVWSRCLPCLGASSLRACALHRTHLGFQVALHAEKQ